MKERMVTLGIFGAALLVAGLIVESAVAVIMPQPIYRKLLMREPAMYNVGEVLPYTLRPGYQGVLTRPEFSVQFQINSLGFRGPEIGEGRKVLIIGDSFTFGWGVGDNANFSALIRVEGAVVVNGGFTAGRA